MSARRTSKRVSQPLAPTESPTVPKKAKSISQDDEDLSDTVPDIEIEIDSDDSWEPESKPDVDKKKKSKPKKYMQKSKLKKKEPLHLGDESKGDNETVKNEKSTKVFTVDLDPVLLELVTPSENADRATCKHCTEVFMILTSTTSIFRHMQKKHPAEIKAARQKQEDQEQKDPQKNGSVSTVRHAPQIAAVTSPPVVKPVSLTAVPQSVTSPMAVQPNRNNVPGPNDIIWELVSRSENNDRGNCNYCKEVFMLHNSTTAILRHLQKAHPAQIKEARQRRDAQEQ